MVLCSVTRGLRNGRRCHGAETERRESTSFCFEGRPHDNKRYQCKRYTSRGASTIQSGRDGFFYTGRYGTRTPAMNERLDVEFYILQLMIILSLLLARYRRGLLVVELVPVVATTSNPSRNGTSRGPRIS